MAVLCPVLRHLAVESPDFSTVEFCGRKMVVLSAKWEERGNSGSSRRQNLVRSETETLITTDQRDWGKQGGRRPVVCESTGQRPATGNTCHVDDRKHPVNSKGNMVYRPIACLMREIRLKPVRVSHYRQDDLHIQSHV